MLAIEAPPPRGGPVTPSSEDCLVSLGATGPDGAEVRATAQVPLDFLHTQPRRARLMLTCDLERSLAGAARRAWGEGRLCRDGQGQYTWELDRQAAVAPAPPPAAVPTAA